MKTRMFIIISGRGSPALQQDVETSTGCLAIMHEQ
jgi:hypothetical protein